MAIDTINEKLALISWENVWMDSVPVSSNGIGLDDKHQLLWGYPWIPFESVWRIMPVPTSSRIFTPADE